jgi:DTW domain-containing protein YfiP
VSRRDNADVRCPRCRVHIGLCFCAELPTLSTRTRLVLYVHRDEVRKSTNTGLLAAACLPNSEVIVRGHRESPTPRFEAPEGSVALLLFPHEGVPFVDEVETRGAPVTLVVPDGTWRQASKIRQRVPGMDRVACVALRSGPPSRYRLRAEAHEKGLATLEAIARALDALGDSPARAPLERALRMLVDRTLWSRGLIDASDVTDGLPEGAERHDPRSGLRERLSGAPADRIVSPPR